MTTAKNGGYSGRRKIQRYRCLRCNATFVNPTVERPLGTHYVDLDTTARVPELLMMEGMSVRAISSLTGLHLATILSLMLTAGEKCQRLLDVKIRGIRPHLVQADELHSIIRLPCKAAALWCAARMGFDLDVARTGQRKQAHNFAPYRRPRCRWRMGIDARSPRPNGRNLPANKRRAAPLSGCC